MELPVPFYQPVTPTLKFGYRCSAKMLSSRPESRAFRG
jgi:hypothetical protein